MDKVSYILLQFPNGFFFINWAVKPTNKRSAEVLRDFGNITGSSIGHIIDFVNSDFRGEGLEFVEPQTLRSSNHTPAFLDNVSHPVVRAWSQTVHKYWSLLIRETNTSAICPKGPQSSCESSLIPLNHTFVVPGMDFFGLRLRHMAELLIRWSFPRTILLG